MQTNTKRFYAVIILLAVVAALGVFLLRYQRVEERQISGPPQKIAFLIGTEEWEPIVEGIKAALADEGFAEGESVVYETAIAGGFAPPVVEEAAKEVVASNPDIVVGVTTNIAISLFEQTKDTEILGVFTYVTNPIAPGIVKSMQEPGTHFTGIRANDADIMDKRLEFLKEVVPFVKKILVLSEKGFPPSAIGTESAKSGGEKLGLDIIVVEVSSKSEVDAELARLSSLEADAVTIVPSVLLQNLFLSTIVPKSMAANLPTMGLLEQDALGGALIGYATRVEETGRQAGGIIARILRGTHPSVIPVEFPNRYNKTINLVTARVLGINISDKAIQLADEVIDE